MFLRDGYQRFWIVLLIVLSVLAASCAGSEEAATSADDFGPVVDSVQNPVPATEPTSSSPGESTTTAPTSASTESVPEQLALVETAELSADLPRETPLGIVITRQETTVDFGNGDEPATEISAEFNGLGPALFLDLSEPGNPAWVFPDQQLDSAGWVINAGIFLVVLEVGPAVVEIQVAGSQGSTDVTVANDNSYAFSAVRADGLEDVTIEAFDASGGLISSCIEDDGFFECQ